jgi:hypothetical protein
VIRFRRDEGGGWEVEWALVVVLRALAIRQRLFVDLKHVQTYQDGSDVAQRLDNEFVCVRVSNDDTKKYG